MLFQVGLKGSVGVSFVLASAKMAKVPTVVKTTKIQRNMRSTTMATYCQSSLSCARMDEKKQSSDKKQNVHTSETKRTVRNKNG